MSSKTPRTIHVGDTDYVWRVSHRHNVARELGVGGCVEVFTAFAAGRRRSPIRLLFPASAEHGSGYPGQAGVVCDYREPTWSLNLNRPKVARGLILLALSEGWDPTLENRERVIANGYELLRRRRVDLNALLEDLASARASRG